MSQMRFILGEIAYQTILHGLNASLEKYSRRKGFIPYNMYIGNYGLSNSNKQDKKKIPCWSIGSHKVNWGHDPDGSVLKHILYVFVT
jgi:hypothetical protein